MLIVLTLFLNINVLPVRAQGYIDNAKNNLYNSAGQSYDVNPEAKSQGKQGVLMMFGKVISVILGFLGTLLTIIILYAGFLWLTAGGNQDQISKARTWLINSVIGLIIVLSASGISNFIISVMNK